MKRFLVIFVLASFASIPAYAQVAKPVVKATAKPVAKAPVVAAPAAAAQPVVAQPVVTATTAAPAAPAPAAPATPTVAPATPMSLGSTIASEAVKLVFGLVGILLAILITVLGKKYKFEAEAAKVNEILKFGSGYAEQLSLKKLKLDGKPNEAGQKMKDALGMALKLAESYGLKEKGEAYWESLLEGWLGVQKVAVTAEAPKS